MIMKPPARPTPRTGGGPKTAIIGVVDLRGNCSRKLVGDRLVVEVAASCRSSKSLEGHEHRAEIRPEGVEQQRLPGDAHRRVRRPSVLWAIC